MGLITTPVPTQRKTFSELKCYSFFVTHYNNSVCLYQKINREGWYYKITFNPFTIAFLSNGEDSFSGLQLTEVNVDDATIKISKK